MSTSLSDYVTNEELMAAARTFRKLRAFYEDYNYTAISHFEFLDAIADYAESWVSNPLGNNGLKHKIEGFKPLLGL